MLYDAVHLCILLFDVGVDLDCFQSDTVGCAVVQGKRRVDIRDDVYAFLLRRKLGSQRFNL